MKTYVLSLPDDHARRQQLNRSFGESAREFVYVDAIDGRNGHVPNAPPPCAKNRRRPMTGPEVACSLGHMGIYERILNEVRNGEYCLVLEDDVQGTAEALKNIESLASDLPPGSVIILGGQQGMARARHLYGYLSQWQGVFRVPHFQLRNLARTCCYMLGVDVARSILLSQQKCLNRADDWVALLSNVRNVYYLDVLQHPVLDGLNSHIEQTRSSLYQDGFRVRWKRDGVRESLARPLTRWATSLLSSAVGLHRIHVSYKSTHR